MDYNEFTGPVWLRKLKFFGLIGLVCFACLVLILLVFK